MVPGALLPNDVLGSWDDLMNKDKLLLNWLYKCGNVIIFTWWWQFLNTFPPVQAGAASKTWHSLLPWSTKEWSRSRRISIWGCTNTYWSLKSTRCSYSAMLESTLVVFTGTEISAAWQISLSSDWVICLVLAGSYLPDRTSSASCLGQPTGLLPICPWRWLQPTYS